MIRLPRFLLVTLTAAALLAPAAALAQSCGKRPIQAVACPEGHVWEPAVMLCMPPAA